MAKTATLSVQVSAKTREALLQAAEKHDAAGASAMAREILEQWAEEEDARATRRSLRDALSFLKSHPDWNDEPGQFFSASPVALPEG